MPPKGRKRKSAAATSPKSKKPKTNGESEIPEKYIRQQAEEFLQSLHISTATPPSSKDVLQLLVACLILSARMNETISTKTFVILKNEYDDCDFGTLSKASWDDLCGVLTEGGYAHYREKTATYIQELCTTLKEKYAGDALKLRVEGKDHAVEKVKSRVKEFKGIGETGSDIFVRGAQVWWDELFPFLDAKRGRPRAEQLMNDEK